MSELDAERIAKRLGLTDAVICQLRAHGYLQRLAVTAHELDARIYRAHLAYLKRDALPPSTRTRPGHAGDLHHVLRTCLRRGMPAVEAQRGRARDRGVERAAAPPDQLTV